MVGLCQVGVFWWKRYHLPSFNLASLVAMWIFPVGFMLSQDSHPIYTSPFFYAWLLFSALMAALLAAVHQSTLAEATPGVVYGILEQVFLNCMFVASTVLTGVFALVLVPPLANVVPSWFLVLFFGSGAYAVYFAVLSRDITGVISEAIIKRLGFVAKPSGGAEGSGSTLAAIGNKCALCGGVLDIVDEGSAVEEGVDGCEGPNSTGKPYALRRSDGSIVIMSGGRQLVIPGGGIPGVEMGSLGYPSGPAGGVLSPSNQDGESSRRGPKSPISSSSSTTAQTAPKTLRFSSRDGKTIMFQLTCKHVFHRTCLAGWCVVGKKGVCPCCSERVDMGVVYSHSPLIGKTSAMFAQITEVARYLVVCVCFCFACCVIVVHPTLSFTLPLNIG